MNGAFMVLSFHVQTKDSIKCYMYLNAQFCRFFPNYIKHLLPRYFTKTDENDSFVISQCMMDMIQSLNGKLRDGEFESFYNKYGASGNSFT